MTQGTKNSGGSSGISKESLHNYLELIRFLNESTDDYLFVADMDKGRIRFFGDIDGRYDLPRPREDGYTMEEWYHLVHPRDLPALKEDLERVRRGESDVHDMEYRLVDREGRRVWISCRGKCGRRDNGVPFLMFGRVSDKVLGHKTDPLTGLLNEQKLSEDLTGCLDKEMTGYLLVLGIDNLKNINMKYGRGYGNRVIRHISDVLDEEVEPSMRIYRLNGDRFGVNLTGFDRDKVEDLYGSLRKRVAKYCTVSAGAVAYDGARDRDSAKLYQYGETTLDQAKKGGRDTLVFFSRDSYVKGLERINLQEELRAGVKDGFRGFYVVYQPQIELGTCRMTGAEALLRFKSPSRGATVGPGEFIPILEQTGLIDPVGRWVLKTALLQCREWRKRMPDFRISVNISYAQLRKETMGAMVLELLEETGVPGDALTLELTESMQLQDYPYYNRIFYTWQRAGVKVSIDDFGTGYSSLGYLKGIESDEVKIDRCFVTGISGNTYNYSLLRNVIALAHSAQIRVCCEGVETEDELLTLKKLRPDLMQGFLFAKPHDKETFEEIYFCEDSSLYKERETRESQLFGLEGGQEFPDQEQAAAGDFASIVENLDETVCVCDADSGEVLYMNSAARRRSGCYDYRGMTCGEMPCCGSLRLSAREKPITWKGRPARMLVGSGLDETDKEIMNKEI